MNNNPTKQYWKIIGWDGTKKLFEHKIGTGQIGEKKLKELLKALASKISLSETEIIRSYVNKGEKLYIEHLEVRRLQGEKHMYECGTNPRVTAEVENETT